MIAAERAAAREPAGGLFDHPAAWLRDEALLILLRLDDLHRDGGGGANVLISAGLIGIAARQERSWVVRRV